MATTTLHKMATRLILRCLLMLRLLMSVDNKFIQGVLETKENWAFLSRFCFLSKSGRYEYLFEYPSEYKVQNLLIYHDDPSQWKAVFKTNLDCYGKEALINEFPNVTQIVNLTVFDYYTTKYDSGCSKINDEKDGNFTFKCHAIWTFTSRRSKWWYMAISNCQSKKGLYLKYKIQMFNGDPSDHWFGHFSADEFYIIHNLLIYLILYILLLLTSLYAARGLKQRGLFHPTFKLYLASVTCQTLGLMFSFAAYNEYAKNGKEIRPLKTLGRVLGAVNNLLFIYLILLVSKGYTITRAKLSNKSRLRLTLFISLYTICFVILFVFEIVVFDPGQVLYIYESPGGYGILILRFIAWLMLLYAVGFTLKHHPHKLPFYVPFLLFYSLWFLSGPILVIIITYVIDNWVRETVATVLDLSVSFLGHLFFLNLTWPTSANKNFPFHIKTTQIRALEQLENSDGLDNSQSLSNFGRHPYEAPPIKVNHLFVSKQIDLQEIGDQNGARSTSVNKHSIRTATTAVPIFSLTELK